MSANVTADADPTMTAIREILHDSAPVADGPDPKAAKVQTKKIKVPKAQEEVRVNAAKSFKSASEAKPLENRSLFQAAKSSFQSNRKLIGLMAILALVFFRPHWVFLSVVLVLFLTLGAFVLLGADRVWGGAMRGLKYLGQRSPEKVQQWVKRLDKFALRWDAILDRFPEGAVDGLYLPDFQSLMEAEDQHDAVIDARLSRLQAEG